MFAPFHDIPKVTIFGSARTQAADPLYVQARDVAAHLPAAGWMVVTGAGPGIMQAGMEGAGRDMSIGVSIRLPFEQGANHVIAGDEKYVSMKYFFTRKLMLIKESKGFVCLPGGFRHARRDVRAAHADPDRQGPAGADRVPRHARRPVLGDRARLRRPPARASAGWSPRPTPSCTWSPTTARRRSTRCSASTATTTRSVTSAICW